mmetsp:Transcript_49907/g.139709  ORF Transcript_49907/g.139709 Transcript_49907/m.139709 type:complete len:235 (-) Transcript_49907:222-926(-)
MWKAVARTRGVASAAAVRTTAWPRACQPLKLSRTLSAGATDGGASDGGAPGGPPNPFQILEQLQDTAQKVGASAGLPTSLDDAQAKLQELKTTVEVGTSVGLPTSLDEAQSKLQELKATVEEKVPSMASLAMGDEAMPQKLQKSFMPFISAGAVLLRVQGELRPEQEAKLLEVMPEPFVETIRRLAPAIPKDPSLELTEAMISRLDGIQGQLAELRNEMAERKAADAPPSEPSE